MEANKIRLLEFLGSSKRTFHIPVYQRNYDWKKEQCSRLFHDVENIAINNFELSHFIGTVVYVVSSTHPTYIEFVLIDGQQRITSVTLLIKALYDAMQNENMKNEIYETYLINKFAPEELRVKLKPIDSDCDCYRNVINGMQLNTDSNISKNYLLFKRLVFESQIAPELLYEALNNVELVYIALDANKKSENPQLIFESLNSTGLSLTQGDLIRNFLLMNHTYEEQNNLYKKYWMKIERMLTNCKISDFVRDYLTLKTCRIPNKDMVYADFKDYVRSLDNIDEEGVLEELLQFSEYYSWLILCNSEINWLNELLLEINQMKSTVSYPALMYMFEDYFIYKKMSKEDIEDIIKLIVKYLYRRTICGYATHGLNKVFSSLIKAIDEDEDTPYKEKVYRYFMSRVGNGAFPRNEEFKISFVNRDLYKSQIDRYTLIQIEKSLTKEAVDTHNTDDITIEHIIPQKLTPSWQIALGSRFNEVYSKYLHTIGNLTLTGYNPELSNKSFAEKKDIYEDSNFCITRMVLEYNQWNENSVKNRAERLYKMAEKIWGVNEEVFAKYSSDSLNYNMTYNIMDEINVTGEKPRQLVFMDMEYSVSSWKDILRELCKQLYELDDEHLIALINNKEFQGRDRKFINTSQEGMISPYAIASNLYIETNMNANTIISYCKMLVEEFELQEDVAFSLRGKNMENLENIIN